MEWNIILFFTVAFLIYIALTIYFMIMNDIKQHSEDVSLYNRFAENYKIPEPISYTSETLTYKPKFNRQLFPRHRKYLKHYV